jgi:hypothetical protein
LVPWPDELKFPGLAELCELLQPKLLRLLELAALPEAALCRMLEALFEPDELDRIFIGACGFEVGALRPVDCEPKCKTEA